MTVSANYAIRQQDLGGEVGPMLTYSSEQQQLHQHELNSQTKKLQRLQSPPARSVQHCYDRLQTRHNIPARTHLLECIAVSSQDGM